MIRYSVVAAVLLASAAPAAGDPLPSVGTWTTFTWSNSVADIAASGDAVWWATTGGAVRVDLDDLSVSVINRARGTLVSDTLTSVCVDAAGTVWFGSADRGVSGYDPVSGSWRRIQEIDGLPKSRVRTLACVGEALWAGTSDGFAEFRDGSATSNACVRGIDLDCGLVSFDVLAILIAGDSRWFGTAAGVSLWSEGVWDTLEAGLPAGDVPSLARLGGDVWAVAGGRPYRFTGSAWTPESTGLPAATVRRLATLDGGLHAATSHGVFRWGGASWSRLGGSLDATCMTLDAHGTLWAGTPSAGAHRWDGSAWRQVFAPGPLTDRAVRSIAVDATSGVWFTHEYPVLGHFDGARWEQFTSDNTGSGLEAKWTAGLLAERDGTVWVGHCCCSDDESCRTDRRSNDTPPVWRAFPFRDVMTMSKDPSGDLWMGTVAGGQDDVMNGVYVLPAGETTGVRLLVENTGGCMPSNQVRAVLAPSDGRVILGSLGDGVAVWDYGPSIDDLTDDACAKFSTSTGGLPSNDVKALLVRGGELWVGTTAGISVIDLASGDARFITAASGLAGSQVTGLAADRFGRVWAATRGGVSRITPGADAEEIDNTTWPELVNDRVNAVAIDARRGQIWFGTDRGLSRYQAWDPGRIEEAGLDASVYPNPFRPAVDGTLRLLVNGGIPVRGEVYDVAGRRIAVFDGVSSGGTVWDGRTSSGGDAASGSYVIVVRSSGRSTAVHVAVLR
jgi:ligand-binding sensor domain-containing protein